MTRYHTDGCEHGEDAFVGSYELPDHTDRPGGRCDVYVDFNSEVHPHVCIRYGEHASKYFSPGYWDFMPYTKHGASDPDEARRQALVWNAKVRAYGEEVCEAIRKRLTDRGYK